MDGKQLIPEGENELERVQSCTWRLYSCQRRVRLLGVALCTVNTCTNSPSHTHTHTLYIAEYVFKEHSMRPPLLKQTHRELEVRPRGLDEQF